MYNEKFSYIKLAVISFSFLKMFEIPLLGKFLSSTTDSNHHLGDVADQLHQKVTVTILILCTLFLGGKQQFGQPIQCMLPAHLDRKFFESCNLGPTPMIFC